jgi:hypothetical protein
MFSAKVWAYRELSGKRYSDVPLSDGAKARIDFLEGVTTQRSFAALGRALEEKIGSCRITAMNKLALFDESDGLSEEQKLKLFRTRRKSSERNLRHIERVGSQKKSVTAELTASRNFLPGWRESAGAARTSR